MKYAWTVEHVIKGIFRRYRTQWETMQVMARVTRGCVSSDLTENFPFNEPLPWMRGEEISAEDKQKALEEALPELEKLIR